MFRFWKNVGKIYIIPIIMCVITLEISRYVDFYNLPVLLFGIVLYTIVYCFLNWALVMNDYEKDLLCVPFQKVFR